MTPTKPPTAREKYGGGRASTDRAYNAARAHDPTEKALHGRRWQELRRLALQRDGHLCVECRAMGLIVRATDVDHIKPRRTHRELFYDLDNLKSLCRSCHNSKTRSEGK